MLVENFGPGAMDRMGFSWEHIQELNPKLIYGSVKGFDDQSPYSDLKVYDNVAQCAGGAASTTGFWDGPPTVSGAALGDSNSGMHLAIGILTALIGRQKTGKGQKVSVAMQDCVLNLCRVKLRDQLRLERVGYLEEYPQYPNGTFGDTVPRGGNAGGGGQPGWVLKCKGWETDPECVYLLHHPGAGLGADLRGSWVSRSGSTTRPIPRPAHGSPISSRSSRTSRSGLPTRPNSKRSIILRPYGIPCAPVLSMKEIAYDPALRASATIVEVPHKQRGPYLTVGSPIKFSDFAPVITGSPLLGEHTDEVLTGLGYTPEQIAKLREAKVLLKDAARGNTSRSQRPRRWRASDEALLQTLR